MVSCKLYRSPCFGKSLRFFAESFNSPVFTAFSSSLSKERDSWEFWQKGCIFITIGGLLTPPPPSRSRILIISLVSPRNFTYLYDPWDRVSTALGGFGFGFTTASLVNIPITSLSLVAIITGFSLLSSQTHLHHVSDHPKSRTLACEHMITCVSVWHVMSPGACVSGHSL